MKHRVVLIKADIDRFCTNPDFKDRFSFPKGKGTLSYLVKLFILFFVGKKHCFRAIFYKRIGHVSYLIKWLFPVKYNTLSIICDDIEGGYLLRPSIRNSIKL